MKYPAITCKVDPTNRVVIGFACENRIKAVTKCDKDDIFDPAFGTKLTAAKVRKTYAKKKLQSLKETKRYFNRQIDLDIAAAERAVQKQTDRIDEIKTEKYPKD